MRGLQIWRMARTSADRTSAGKAPCEAVSHSRAVEEVHRSPSRPSKSVTKSPRSPDRVGPGRGASRGGVVGDWSRTGTDGTDVNRGHSAHLAPGPGCWVSHPWTRRIRVNALAEPRGRAKARQERRDGSDGFHGWLRRQA